MFNHSILIYSNKYLTKATMKSDPVITYNHMEDDDANNKMKHLKNAISGKLIYIAEFAIIITLLCLMFFLF
jgi:hypothetical protein